MAQAEERSHTPRRRYGKDGHEGQANAMIYVRPFAPALEHGNHSNKEQYDYTGSKNL